ALVARPGDADAMMLQSEATGLGIIEHAKRLAKMGYYIEGGRELTKALQSLPDNAEAKQLLTDYKHHEPEQRLERPEKAFDSAMTGMNDESLFESHELKTVKPAGDTHSAILTQLTTVQAIFQ